MHIFHAYIFLNQWWNEILVDFLVFFIFLSLTLAGLFYKWQRPQVVNGKTFKFGATQTWQLWTQQHRRILNSGEDAATECQHQGLKPWSRVWVHTDTQCSSSFEQLSARLSSDNWEKPGIRSLEPFYSHSSTCSKTDWERSVYTCVWTPGSIHLLSQSGRLW